MSPTEAYGPEERRILSLPSPQAQTSAASTGGPARKRTHTHMRIVRDRHGRSLRMLACVPCDHSARMGGCVRYTPLRKMQLVVFEYKDSLIRTYSCSQARTSLRATLLRSKQRKGFFRSSPV